MLKTHPHKHVIYWLLSGCLLISMMVIIGGVTRLTNSGLSMTDWSLISEVIPPLNEAEWTDAFEEYKKFPEYQKINIGMELPEFKKIFFWEYFHRLFGRVIGLVFIIPCLFFWIKNRLPQGFKSKMVLIFFLGGFQGFLGWWMVKSGLVDRPEVSHLRLAAHLISAFALISYTFWVMLELHFEKPLSAHPRLNKWIKWFLPLLVIQIIYGGFVAGLKAGLLCPSFPSMCNVGHLLQGNWLGNVQSGMPEHLVKLNLQNIHRLLAYGVYIVAAIMAYKSRSWKLSGLAQSGVNTLFLLVNLQFLLGVFTLLYEVPISLGVLHQFGALLVLLSSVFLLKVSR